MKALVCEMCGSHDLIKKDGYYVCQNCGTKYAPEEAKNLLVEINGPVKVEVTKDIESAKRMAENAFNRHDGEEAYQYYTEVVEANPDDYESEYRRLLARAMGLTLAKSSRVAEPVSGFPKYIQAVKSDDTLSEEERGEKISWAFFSVAHIVNSLCDLAHDVYFEDFKFSSSSSYKNFLDYIGTFINYQFSVLDNVSDDLKKYPKTNIDENYEVYCDNIQFWLEQLSKKYYSTIGSETLALSDSGATNLVYNPAKKLALLYKKIKPDYLLPSSLVSKAEGGKGVQNGCYLTTACVEAKGLPDNCYELTVLRNFRDNWLAKQPNGIDDINLYYETAPKIVNIINEMPDANIRWIHLYNELVKPCVTMIDNKQYQDAYNLYKSISLSLSKEFLN